MLKIRERLHYSPGKRNIDVKIRRRYTVPMAGRHAVVCEVDPDVGK